MRAVNLLKMSLNPLTLLEWLLQSIKLADERKIVMSKRKINFVRIMTLSVIGFVITLIGGTVAVKAADINQELIAAARKGHLEEIEHLLNEGADVNVVENNSGMTALMIVAYDMGQFDEVAKLLLDKGANVNAKAKDGNTALMGAVLKRKYNLAKLLLDKGADINVQDKYGNTALKWATDTGRQDVVNLLKDHGASSVLVLDTHRHYNLSNTQNSSVYCKTTRKTRMFTEHNGLANQILFENGLLKTENYLENLVAEGKAKWIPKGTQVKRLQSLPGGEAGALLVEVNGTKLFTHIDSLSCGLGDQPKPEVEEKHGSKIIDCRKIKDFLYITCSADVQDVVLSTNCKEAFCYRQEVNLRTGNNKISMYGFKGDSQRGYPGESGQTLLPDKNGVFKLEICEKGVDDCKYFEWND